MPRSALEAELRRREARVGGLVKQHAKLVAAARKLEAKIRQLGGDSIASPLGGKKRGAKPGVKRPRNERNLVESLAALLKGRSMNVTKITDEVQKAGYNTTSPNFRTIVNQTLINSNRFKKVSRGVYTAK